MSLTTAAFKVHKIYEYIIPTTYSVEIDGLSATPSKSFKNYRKGPFNKILFGSQFLGLAYYIPRLLWVVKFGVNSTPLFELAGSALIAAFHIVAIALWYTEVTYFTEFCMIANQSAFLKDFRRKYPKSFFGIISLQELFVYSFALTGGLISIGVVFAPTVIYFIPVQTYFGTSFITIILSIIVHAWECSLLWLHFVLFLIMTVAYLDTVYILSEQSLRCRRFEELLQYNRAAIILSQLQDYTFQIFYVSCIAVGVPAISITLFGTIRLSESVEATVYVLFVVMTLVGFLVPIILTYMGSMPYQNFALSRQKWLAKTRSILVRRLLKSLCPAGIHLGPYSLVTPDLGIRICDDIINNTVNLLCLY